ncbi:MAG: hypothetical protein JXB14_00250 [Candidatus Altiarchaeota archaeon]|nr:hypothetical protein [Candidatus Altiarchaeota archaeon]
MSVRKPKFIGKRTKWEKKRAVKRVSRAAAGKKPVVEPLQIAPVAERQKALRQGRMVFYDGGERIEVDLKGGVLGGIGALQGMYKTFDGRVILLRSDYTPVVPTIDLFELRRGASGILEENRLPDNFFQRVREELSHIKIDENLRGQKMGLKGLSKTERDARSVQEGYNRQYVLRKFTPKFLRLRYGYARPTTWDMGVWDDLEKRGKHQPKDDLEGYHRIEAIDPKTGKARIFTFPIRK